MISIIIPTYNRSQILLQAIESVQSQNYGDLEILVIDDGSTDNTKSVMNSIQDSRLRYYFQENSGLSAARNTGIRHSRGEYLAFLDDDDRFLPEKLSAQMQKFESQPELGFVAGGWQDIDIGGNPIRENRPWERHPSLDLSTWLMACPVITCSVLLKKGWIDRIGMFDEALPQSEDWDFWLRLAYAGCRMEWVREIVCEYQIHPNTMAQNARKQRDNMLRVLDKFFLQNDLPMEIAEKYALAFSSAYLRGAMRQFISGADEAAAADLLQAIELEPELMAERSDHLVNTLVGWAGSPLVCEPDEFLTRVFQRLPDSAAGLKSRRDEARGKFALMALLEARRRQDWRTVRGSLARLARVQPALLFNRGLISSVLEMMFGSRFWQWMRKPIHG